MPRPKKNANERKIITIKTTRIPLVKLIVGKEIREAAKALEDFRLKMKEEEILMGATLTIKRDAWDDAYHLVATRPETDQEMADRIEKARLAAEAKKRREAEKKAAEAKRAEERKLAEKLKAMETIHKLAKENGLSVHDLVDKWTV
jgi:Lon protease-like protein